MRASRLVSVLLLLQNRQRLTARQLAEELEVSVRTIYRDVESLIAAGVPVVGEPGHDGGYRLLGGYRTRLTGLTAAEAETLLLTGLPGVASELGVGPLLAATRLKLLAALPAELRERAGQLADCFHLDAPGWYRDREHVPRLAELAEAVWQRRPVRLRYLRWAQPHEIERTVRPLGLVVKAGTWYLVAQAERIRTYRVSRILELAVLDDTFDRPTGFDLAAYWTDYLDQFDRRRHRATAKLRVTPGALTHLPGASVLSTTPDGRHEVELPIESVEWAVPELLRLGGDVEVLAPDDLRAAMTKAATELASLYPVEGAQRE
ncbi:putative DNA-binding transcriptional regulator YafY [Pseudonocardia eucalypti]|nr:putative DNA-binding transcriptional regulator YafY [Pseudonocardia eucalypti]